MEKYCECGDHLYDHLNKCPFCGGEKISDTDLLDFILKRNNINYDNLRQEYIESNKDIKSE